MTIVIVGIAYDQRLHALHFRLALNADYAKIKDAVDAEFFVREQDWVPLAGKNGAINMKNITHFEISEVIIGN